MRIVSSILLTALLAACSSQEVQQDRDAWKAHAISLEQRLAKKQGAKAKPPLAKEEKDPGDDDPPDTEGGGPDDPKCTNNPRRCCEPEVSGCHVWVQGCKACP